MSVIFTEFPQMYLQMYSRNFIQIKPFNPRPTTGVGGGGGWIFPEALKSPTDFPWSPKIQTNVV